MEGLIWDEVTQMHHPDTPENRAILSSKSWKMMCLLWGPPAKPLPRYVTGFYLPAVKEHDEGKHAQNGPVNPYAEIVKR